MEEKQGGTLSRAGDILQPHAPHRNQAREEVQWGRVLPRVFFLVGASQGHFALGSYCLRSLSLLKVFQECGGLTHSSLSSQSEVHKTAFPFSHSYSNTGPHASQMELAGGIWGRIFFAQDMKVDEELRSRSDIH